MKAQRQNLDFPRCGAVRSPAFVSLLPLRAKVVTAVVVAFSLYGMSFSAGFDPVRAAAPAGADGDRPAIIKTLFQSDESGCVCGRTRHADQGDDDATVCLHAL